MNTIIYRDILHFLRSDSVLTGLLGGADKIHHHLTDEATAAPFCTFTLTPESSVSDSKKGRLVFTIVDKYWNTSQAAAQAIDHLMSSILTLNGQQGDSYFGCTQIVCEPKYEMNNDREEVIWTLEVDICWL